MPDRTGSSQQKYLGGFPSGFPTGFLLDRKTTVHDCKSNPSSKSSSSGSYKSTKNFYAPDYNLVNEINTILVILKSSLSLEESKSQFKKLIKCYHALDVDVKDTFTERIKEHIKSHFCKFPNHVFDMLQNSQDGAKYDIIKFIFLDVIEAILFNPQYNLCNYNTIAISLSNGNPNQSSVAFKTLIDMFFYIFKQESEGIAGILKRLGKEEEVDDSYYCPISGDIMIEPIQEKGTTAICDEKAFLEAISKTNQSPFTRKTNPNYTKLDRKREEIHKIIDGLPLLLEERIVKLLESQPIFRINELEKNITANESYLILLALCMVHNKNFKTDQKKSIDLLSITSIKNLITLSKIKPGEPEHTIAAKNKIKQFLVEHNLFEKDDIEKLVKERIIEKFVEFGRKIHLDSLIVIPELDTNNFIIFFKKEIHSYIEAKDILDQVDSIIKNFQSDLSCKAIYIYEKLRGTVISHNRLNFKFS
tara:strand:- start:2689 stop:4113 length:1425 start_codon:yes stop_codon:yes gene_type:complete